MNGDEEFFDAVAGEQAENWATPRSDAAFVGDGRTLGKAMQEWRGDMVPVPVPSLETELTFGPQEITRKANWVFSLSKSCYGV